MKDILKPIISIEKLQTLSNEAKASILAMTTLAKSGHPGGSMSSLDLLLALYHCINIDPKEPFKHDRDRVVISHGHISPAVYSVLAMRGYFDLYDAITQFRLAGSPFEGHVEPLVPGVEWTTGNLGQGLSAACGFALECRLKSISNHIYCIMGDGEQQKGQISEARRFAVKYGLNNLTAIVDYNKIQICGNVTEIMPQNIKANYESDGWGVIQINGHDYREIFEALNKAQNIDAPVLILAKTIMGKGVSFMENKEKYHGMALTDEELMFAFKDLNYIIESENEKDINKTSPTMPDIMVGKEKKTHTLTEPEYRDNGIMHREKRKSIKENKLFATYNLNPEQYIFDFQVNKEKYYEKSTDNRSAWGDALADIARKNKDTKRNIAVFDCDLMGSVKTSEFNKILPENFFQAGIAEHHTAVCAGAISKYGIQTFFAGFGMFGLTEVYNQHRLNDINFTNLKVVLTHVGLDVGEDGKTHHCVDYIGLVNNMFGFKLIIPADPNQTYKAINYVVNQKGNWLIAMGRSKLDIIRNDNDEVFFGKDYLFEYGKVDVLKDGNAGTLYVTGTLVNTAIKVVKRLSLEGLNLRLVNIPSPLEIDTEEILRAYKTGMIFTLEDHNVKTGLGDLIAQKIVEAIGTQSSKKDTENINPKRNFKLIKFGVENYAFSGSAEDVYKTMGLDEESLIARIKKEF
ncbi:MAG: transketolase family protein [Candidatus Cloacimonetes bacterium]|nr:transketolase family protein [Candidatus Cloacimonadota bacterium]